MLIGSFIHRKERISNIETQLLFGRYEILSVLGTGATGTVYLARHLKLKTFRAVKCLSKTCSMPSSIFSEATLLENLKHPGIPIIYDVEEDDAYIYIIEEYVQGESLEDILLQQESVSQEYMIEIGVKICEILIFLHNQAPIPILYQDLKPSHIIVCGNQVKIIDFGIASYITSQGKNYHNYGTYGFAAPEQSTSAQMAVTSDIYSLGMIFRFYAKRNGRQCSERFRYIIRKSTKKNPKKRYASAEALRKALLEVRKADDLPISILLQNISIVGANPGAGSTHIAVAVTSFLNKRGIRCIYTEPEEEGVLEAVARDRRSNVCPGGEVRRGSFCGREVPKQQENIHRSETCDEERCELQDAKVLTVCDYGCNRKQAILEEADITILAVNLSVWRREAALKACEEFKCVPNLVIVCNLSTRSEAKWFAAKTGRRVYCYPVDTDPFGESREKRALFTRMLEEKGER